MHGRSEILSGLRIAGYPVSSVTQTHDGDWIEAEFVLPGGTVMLALPPERASAGEFAFLFDMAVGAKEGGNEG